ncbi:MAG: hypothetical protein AAF658_14265 [Myxococcota bacterium]
MRHGRMTIEIPEDWFDDSDLLFESPPVRGVAVPLSGKPAPEHRSNVSVNFEPKPDGIDNVQQYAEHMEDLVETHGEDTARIRSEPRTVGGRDAHLIVRVVTLTAKVRQYSLSIDAGDRFVLATASVNESLANQQEASLLEILESVRFDSA